jgi:hypothetical protein
MPTTHLCVLVAVSELGDKMSDDGDGHRRTSTDVGGLFSQVNTSKGAGQRGVIGAWGSSMKERGRSSLWF